MGNKKSGKRKINDKLKVGGAIIGILAIIFLFYSASKGSLTDLAQETQDIETTSEAQETQDVETTSLADDPAGLAKCLTEKGVVMYGTEWCGYCKRQKQAFGDSFQYVNYVDCDKEKTRCAEAGVRGYPTWVINGEISPGLKELSQLASLAGC